MHRAAFFRKALATAVLLVGFFVSLLQAGSVIQFRDSIEINGKLTFTPDSIHVVTGATPATIKLDEIIEADFSVAPFQVDCFSSVLDPDRLPAAWRAQDIGDSAAPGTISYAKGELTLTG